MHSKYSSLPFSVTTPLSETGFKPSSTHWIFSLISFLANTDELLSNQECLQFTLNDDIVLSWDTVIFIIKSD